MSTFRYGARPTRTVRVRRRSPRRISSATSAPTSAWRIRKARSVGSSGRSTEPPAGYSTLPGALLVRTVVAGGPADAAGLQPGDLVLSFVGLHVWETISPDNVVYVLDKAREDNLGQIKFYVLRGRETLFGHLTSDTLRTRAAASGRSMLVCSPPRVTLTCTVSPGLRPSMARSTSRGVLTL